jgi:dCTP deaminase
MLLSDADIKEAIDRRALIVDGLRDNCIGPCSIDLHLSRYIHRFDGIMQDEERHPRHVIDPKKDQSHEGIGVYLSDGFYDLMPREFILASTTERFDFVEYAGQLEGKSSLARLGLLVHITAGFFDVGFAGYPTLEVVNMRRWPIRLYVGMPIAQMAIFALASLPIASYGSRIESKYRNQASTTATGMKGANNGDKKDRDLCWRARVGDDHDGIDGDGKHARVEVDAAVPDHHACHADAGAPSA